MSQNTFTDAVVAMLSCLKGDYTDAAMPGLTLSVHERESGYTASWIFRAQVRNNRFKRTLGTYPKIPLAEARERALLCRDILTACFDLTGPLADAVAFRETPKTIRSLWPLWVESEKSRCVGGAQKTWQDLLARGENHVFSAVGDKAPAEVLTGDVARILNNAYITLHESTVRKIHRDIAKFFAWCRASGLYPVGLPPPTEASLLLPLLVRSAGRLKGTPHPALAEKDVRRFVALILSETFRTSTAAIALLFTLLTASRIGNVVGSLNREGTNPAQWKDFNKSLTLWTIPARNMKCGNRNGAHIVPISAQARDILRLMKRRQEERGLTSCPYVFATRNGKRFDYRLIPETIRRLCEADLKTDGNGFVDEETGSRMHTHGFRATFKTWGTNHGVDWTLTELSLHHAIDNLHYDRAKAVSRRKRLMEQWADFCFTEKTRDLLRSFVKPQNETKLSVLLLPPPEKKEP